MSFVLGRAAREAGHDLVAYDTVGSTNAEAMALGREGRAPVWVAARAQTDGRGRRGRTWSTERGNLAASFATVTAANPALAATLGFVAGLALEQALRETAASLSPRAARPELKWPNDVIVDGQKLAGILLEADQFSDGRLAVVVGVGVNVVSAPEGLPYPATSLAARGDRTTAEELFQALADAFVDWLDAWEEGAGLPAIRKAWMARAAGLGSQVTIDMGTRVLKGRFESLDESGRLVLRAPTGVATAVSAGDVYFGNAASVRVEG
ncbi:biotin--[acetyl-CoA-carboxylase] ligase [Chelatococcus sambhunathii]|uniref:biotin--[biotin carboxyl-carrier protein] ligase n=2 Tax=Chelatococcus sambhunathii TaxID=363953 RepID=A0ABU1DK17_9HYPH|nr:biotin--[acetyl-CoA-carboxylase] ligase [Chelatococcus sambhunathii]MDR4308314.1 biotin--[acetyl-CoA-carboxylase] ligase [Chelatococcus sambhunathii]